ncbi:MAG TPA: hypothetical protein VGF45_16110 [Polyangia bacterium]
MTAARRFLLGLSLSALVGCAQSRAAAPAGGFALRTASAGHLSLGHQGEITGPTLQLSPTATGYRGVAGTAGVDVRAEGPRIVGTIRSRVIDMRYEVQGSGLTVSGLFAGRMGRLTASHSEIRSALGVCSYQLAASGSAYEGERTCSYSIMPAGEAHSLKLPAGFDRLSVDRQAMVLAILLSM